MTVVLAQIPNPVNIITDAVGSVTGWAFDKVADGIAGWVLGAVDFFVQGALDFLRTSAAPDVSAAWFAGAGSPYATVRNLAVGLLAAFVFLGLLQGLVNGDPAGMVRRMAGGLPTAVVGMVITTAVVGHLLRLTDALSNEVLASTDEQALHFLSGFSVVAGATQGFAAVVLGLVAVVAGLMLWVELIVRASLVYILVALSPLAFAATLWPSARGALRRTVELLLAVILAKLVIAITLSIGVAALAGAGSAGATSDGLASGAGASVGTLLVGAVLLGLSAFSPFVVLKLLPLAESAVVAAGVSRGPWRAAQTGMAAAYSVNTVQRLAGGGTSSAASGSSALAPTASGPASAGAAAGGATAAGAAVAGPVGVAAGVGATVVSGAAKAGHRVADTARSASDRPRTSTADAPRNDDDGGKR